MHPNSSAPPAPALIRVDGLRVGYGDRWALDELSFQVQAGELVGLLGPNGAGKTTTLSVLATLYVRTRAAPPSAATSGA